MRFHKLALKHCMPESSNGSTEHTSAALQCYEFTEQWKKNCQLKQTSMSLQNEKLDISANSIEPKAKYKRKKKKNKRQKRQKQPCPYSVLWNQSRDKRKEKSTIWKVRTVIMLYFVKQLLTRFFFFLLRKKIMKHIAVLGLIFSSKTKPKQAGTW